MAIVHPEKLVYSVPQNRMDQVVDIINGSISVGAGVTDGFGFVTATTAQHLEDSHDGAIYLMKGLWSADGGASWQKIGQFIDVGDSAGGRRTLQLDVSMFSEDLNGPGGQLEIDATNEGASGYTILYKVLLMARPDQGNKVTTKALVQPLRYSSKQRYMKIAFDDVVTLPTSGSTIIPHNLGYVPDVSAWMFIKDNSDPNPNNGFIFPASVTLDSANIASAAHSNAGNLLKLYYRIYLRA